MIVTVQTQEVHENGGVSESSVQYDRISEVSDGYHTFAELYRIRMLYNAALFNEWAISDAYYEDRADMHNFQVHKSYQHSDGKPCFEKENYFVVVAQLPTGQITNHYKGEFWHLFKIPERTRAISWDGHTPADAEKRLMAFLEGKS